MFFIELIKSQATVYCDSTQGHEEYVQMGGILYNAPGPTYITYITTYITQITYHLCSHTWYNSYPLTPYKDLAKALIHFVQTCILL